MHVLLPHSIWRITNFYDTRGGMLQRWITLLFLGSASCSHATLVVRGQGSAAIDSIVHDLCNRDIAVLGEASHGSGVTFQVKTEIVKRLVDECQYNAFFIESGIYDFLRLEEKQKGNQPIASEEISQAIGGIWDVKELKPLVSFLHASIQKKYVYLGGLDDQIGRATYATKGMAGDLTSYLDSDHRAQCFQTLQNYMDWKYTDALPYDEKANLDIQKCLSRIEVAVKTSNVIATKKLTDGYKIINLMRFFLRELKLLQSATPVPHELSIWSFNNRDSSMFENLVWLRGRMGGSPKVIVWTHDVHAAKDLSKIKSAEDSRKSLGSHVINQFGKSAYILGFSAFSGKEGMKGFPANKLEVAHLSSLEGFAFSNSTDSNLKYFDSSSLIGFGDVSARPTNYIWQTARWSDVYDGLMILRQESPVH